MILLHSYISIVIKKKLDMSVKRKKAVKSLRRELLINTMYCSYKVNHCESLALPDLDKTLKRRLRSRYRRGEWKSVGVQGARPDGYYNNGIDYNLRAMRPAIWAEATFKRRAAQIFRAIAAGRTMLSRCHDRECTLALLLVHQPPILDWLAIWAVQACA